MSSLQSILPELLHRVPVPHRVRPGMCNVRRLVIFLQPHLQTIPLRKLSMALYIPRRHEFVGLRIYVEPSRSLGEPWQQFRLIEDLLGDFKRRGRPKLRHDPPKVEQEGDHDCCDSLQDGVADGGGEGFLRLLSPSVARARVQDDCRGCRLGLNPLETLLQNPAQNGELPAAAWAKSEKIALLV